MKGLHPTLGPIDSKDLSNKTGFNPLLALTQKQFDELAKEAQKSTHEREEQFQNYMKDIERETDLETIRLKVQDPITYAQTPQKEIGAKMEKLLGQRYNEGKLRWWSLIDFNDFLPMIEVLEYGAIKYSPNQWKNGLDMDSIMDSNMRHLIALQGGQERDPESGCLHIGHIMCNIYFYSHFYLLKQKENETKNSTEQG